MWKFCVVLLFGFMVIPLCGQISFGNPEKINDNWKFTLADDSTFSLPQSDVSRWTTVQLPHDWSVNGKLDRTLASCTGYLPGGIGWYRKTIHVSENAKGKKCYLYFEGVYNRSEVFVNGVSVGKRPNGYISFLYDITSYVKWGSNNVIAVRVDHSRYDDSRWYTGSGIYRNVWLVTADPIHIAQWGVFARSEKVSASSATLKVGVELQNETAKNAEVTVINELCDKSGKVVARESSQVLVGANDTVTSLASIMLKKPSLWTLETPYLYTLKTLIQKDGKVLDQTITRTGFRSFTFDPDTGFALNDRSVKMKGVCLHHDAGVLGAAVPREVWKRRLLNLKKLGCNAVRTSHNPQSPDLYDLCDELGILVLNEMYDEWEFPKRKWITGWNKGTPRYNGTFDIFKDWSEIDLADFVRRDRNHVSVFAWSIGNEVDYPNDPYSLPSKKNEQTNDFEQAVYEDNANGSPNAMRLGPIAKRLVATVKKYDTSRPTTAGLAGVSMSNHTAYPGALDIAGYNYTENRYHSDHKTYPRRVIYGSENCHELAPWKAVRDNPHIFGQFLWTGIDYLGESHAWPSRGFSSGLLDLGGFVKPRGEFRKALWLETPITYIGTYPVPKNERAPSYDAWPVWNYKAGEPIRVVCYTNAAKSKLFLNGKPVGDVKKRDDNHGVLYWDVPFASGKLEVVGMDDGDKETCRYAIQTAKHSAKMQITESDDVISKARGVAQIALQIVDAEGVPVTLAEDEITCTIEGPGRLLGLESGNNTDMSDYTDNVHKVYRGRMIAYIEATGSVGRLKVTFTAPNLKTTVAEIDVR